jgi:hypothetical protein
MPSLQNGGVVQLLGAVRGLVTEGTRIAEMIKEIRPEKVGLSISPESLKALNLYIDAGRGEVGPESVEEEIYILELEKFGKVLKPPPCFTEALKQCNSLDIQVVALDMDDVHFTDAYCSHVSGLELIMQGRKSRKLEKRAFESSTPEDFVLEWDSVVNGSKGFRALEREREKVIAGNIAKTAKNTTNMLAVVELERVGGVEDFLKAQDCNYKTLSAHSMLNMR